MWYSNFIVNQKQTPAIISDIFANRPVIAGLGSLFVSTDTLELYRFNGSGWNQLIGSCVGLNTIFIIATETDILTDARLIGKSVKLILRGGIGSGVIITIGTPVGNEILFNSTFGTLEAAENFGGGELITVQYE